MPKFRKVPISTLKVGARLSTPIADPEKPRIKLLAEGTEITEGFIQRLEARGIDSLVLSQRDLAIIHAFHPQGRAIKVPPSHQYVKSRAVNDQTLLLDAELEGGFQFDFQSVERTILTKDAGRKRGAYNSEMMKVWSEEVGQSIDEVVEVFENAVSGSKPNVAPLVASCDDILVRMNEDIDALTCLVCTPYDSDYPVRHGYHLAATAMLIGARMQLDRLALVDLGLGCLLHDVGMKAVGLNLFDTRKKLSPNQLRLLADHPVRAAEVIEKFGDQVSMDARIVAYQIHERGDGSGYPRGYKANQIHDFAKIAGLADAFIGMLSNRRHRMAILGYHAIVALLDDVRARRFDSRVMRALLETVSIHPIGSFVELNDGTVAQVKRSNVTQYDRPSVEANPEGANKEIIDLHERVELKIVRALAPPKAA